MFLRVWDFEQTPLSFLLYSFVSLSHGWSGNVLVKCFNNVSFQYVLTLLSAGNCWDIDLKTKIYTVF